MSYVAFSGNWKTRHCYYDTECEVLIGLLDGLVLDRNHWQNVSLITGWGWTRALDAYEVAVR